MKQATTEISPIHSLALNTINKIEQHYNTRWQVSENRKNALKLLKDTLCENQKNAALKTRKKKMYTPELSLILDFMSIYIGEKSSPGILGVKHSFFCREMAFFLFEAKELFIQEHNKLVNLILDKIDYGKLYDKNWNNHCQKENPVARKAILEEAIYYLDILDNDKFVEFKEDIFQQYGCHHFTQPSDLTLLHLFMKAYEKEDFDVTNFILCSTETTKQMCHHLKDGRKPPAVNKKDFNKALQESFMYTDSETQQSIVCSPLFLENLNASWLQNYLSLKNTDCASCYKLNSKNDAQKHEYQAQLKVIRLSLSIFGTRFDQQWGKDNALSSENPPDLQKLYFQTYLSPRQNKLGFWKYLTFFEKDSKNQCALPQELNGIIKQQFIKLALHEEKMGIAEDDDCDPVRKFT